VGYKPFQVVGLLKYKGDFKEFAKDLAERYDLNKKPQKEGKSESDLDKMLQGAHIDLRKTIPKPPMALSIRDQEGSAFNTTIKEKRLFTLGNFSAITGKGKSKKTFLTTLMLAAAASGTYVHRKIGGMLPKGKDGVLLFDTEQSDYDAWVTAKRVENVLGHRPENFGAFDLREYTPHERCQIIEHALKQWGKKIGFIVIDGIVDLGTAINDEEEANRVVSLLMKWTKVYNVHITNVIHQNKKDNWATGHIGSAILKKAEAIISVTKEPDDPSRSKVECSMIRGVADFNPFDLEIVKGLPEINDITEDPELYDIEDLT
jgi:hypothetical protein